MRYVSGCGPGDPAPFVMLNLHNGRMSRWLERRSVHLAAIVAWVTAMAAAVVLSDSTAPFTAVVWTGFCAGLAYQVLKQRWWTAIAFAALMAQSVLNIVSQGDHSQLEHRAVSATELVVIVYLLIAMIADDKARHRSRTRHRTLP